VPLSPEMPYKHSYSSSAPLTFGPIFGQGCGGKVRSVVDTKHWSHERYLYTSEEYQPAGTVNDQDPRIQLRFSK
jgi:hypothetical protein